MTRTELMDRLAVAQNHHNNVNQDIMTFAGFLNDVELLAHILFYEARAAK